jgi:hypothetical protein
MLLRAPETEGLLAWADWSIYRLRESRLGLAMCPRLLLRHITNAMMNAHKAIRMRATPLGGESKRPM